MQSKSTIDNHREISAALDFLRQASANDGAFELDPRVVSGWVEMSLGALEVLVTAKRGKHADDKALKQTVEEHLEHAEAHIGYAYSAALDDLPDGDCYNCGTDDDGLMHFDHATARIALLYARKAIVEQEAESDRALAQKIKEGANGLMNTTEGIVGIATELYMHSAYQNSCKVEKVEHGTRCGVNWFLYYNTEPSVSVYQTRPIETDNKPGKTDAKCVTPITNWSLYVDDVKVAEVTDVKCESLGTWSVDVPLTFAGVTVPKPKPVAPVPNPFDYRTRAFTEIYQEQLAAMCHGCSYAKWPNKGPGYSARCDKCKLDPNRPGYVSK